MSDLFNVAYNPDVLSCLANLSNDEVFTPPEVANQMLDLLPAELWSDPNATFLDPACKSGVFLREIAKRLIDGLADQFPDLQERLDHIFKKQIFGIATTELCSLLSRRSVYCSKYPNSKYSVVRFETPEGAISYTRMDHVWKKDCCTICGASREKYDRGTSFENFAYAFIHLKNPEKVFDMKFDVIVGNPPYQIGVKSNDEKLGADKKIARSNRNRDKPIYNLFVRQAMALNPKYLLMIIPSRWIASGLGLSDFRRLMLSDKRIRKFVDYPVSSEVFSGVEIKGGVCYFLWTRDTEGLCETISIRDGNKTDPVIRDLNQYDVLVRDSRALPILDKVLKRKEPSIIDILSVDKEFGWTSNFDDFSKVNNGHIPIYYGRNGTRKCGWISRDEIKKSVNLIDTWKVMVPQAGSDGGQKLPDRVLGGSFIAPSPSVCTQTYLFFYLQDEKQAVNMETYLHTRFFRFLVSLRKVTQHATRSTYQWVPIQDFSKPWTDDELYEKYGLSDEERTYIEAVIKPMDVPGDDSAC